MHAIYSLRQHVVAAKHFKIFIYFILYFFYYTKIQKMVIHHHSELLVKSSHIGFIVNFPIIVFQPLNELLQPVKAYITQIFNIHIAYKTISFFTTSTIHNSYFPIVKVKAPTVFEKIFRTFLVHTMPFYEQNIVFFIICFFFCKKIIIHIKQICRAPIRVISGQIPILPYNMADLMFTQVFSPLLVVFYIIFFVW